MKFMVISYYVFLKNATFFMSFPENKMDICPFSANFSCGRIQKKPQTIWFAALKGYINSIFANGYPIKM